MSEVTVSEVGPGRFTEKVQSGRHVFYVDEPVGVGDDAGPDPYALLLSALGACTVMTLRMYADRKNWPAGSILVRLSHRREHASDCADCDQPQSLVDRIDRDLVITGPLTDEQRQRLRQVAEHCPVHRTLLAQPRVVTTVSASPISEVQ